MWTFVVDLFDEKDGSVNNRCQPFLFKGVHHSFWDRQHPLKVWWVYPSECSDQTGEGRSVQGNMDFNPPEDSEETGGDDTEGNTWTPPVFCPNPPCVDLGGPGPDDLDLRPDL